jgi:hypothetical protein
VPRSTTPRASSRSSGGGSRASSVGAAAATGTSSAPAPGLGGGWQGWKEWLGFGTGTKPGPGVRAAFYALVPFGLLAFVVVPFLPIVQTDDRGDQVPIAFRGLYLEARSILSGEDVEAKTTSLMEATGPSVLLYLGLPLLVIIGAIVAFRRTGRSLPLTIAMIVLAVLVLMAGNIYYLPAMVAIAVASFQVRRVEMAGRAAEQAAARGQVQDQDVQDETDVDDEYVDEEYEDEEYEDEDYVEGDEDEDYVEGVEDEEYVDEEYVDDEYEQVDVEDEEAERDGAEDRTRGGRGDG